MLTNLLGLGAMISLFLIYQQKSRRNMLLCKLSADIFWIFHYFTLGATAGMIPNFVGFFRELVFINRKTKKWANSQVFPVFFIAVNLTLGILSYKRWYDIVPIIASSAVTVSLWIDNPRLTKLISIPVSIAFLIYDAFVLSYVGMINESLALISIFIYFGRKTDMKGNVFADDFVASRELLISPGAPIENVRKTFSADVSEDIVKKGDAFANEIEERFVSDFERKSDKMVHVSTFVVIGDTVYMSYYANEKNPDEDPEYQTARLAYAPIDDIGNKTILDIQTIGDVVSGKEINMVYDTILMQKDERTIYIMWTARCEENYYRFYRSFDTETKTLGTVGVNRFKAGDITNDFSTSGIKSALAENGIPIKKMFSDIGIMQKLSSRVENGETYHYTGTYSGDFTCIIKSRDLITWEYVSQPDFINDSMWENATYVLGDRVFYFVRQQKDSKYGFLTAYDLSNKTWEEPIEISDCQSRSDFIFYNGELYLFHAPIDREHIGIVKIDTKNIANSEVILQAKMKTSCFYPFIQYYRNGELAMSYTVDRKHIRLAEFTLKNYI